MRRPGLKVGSPRHNQQLPAFEQAFLRHYRLDIDQADYAGVEPELVAFSTAFFGFWCSDPTRVAAMYSAWTKGSSEVIKLAVKDFFSAPLEQFLPTQAAEEEEENLPGAAEARTDDEVDQQMPEAQEANQQDS